MNKNIGSNGRYLNDPVPKVSCHINDQNCKKIQTMSVVLGTIPYMRFGSE